MKLALVLICLCATIVAEFVSYEGFKVYEIYAKNEEQLAKIEAFKENSLLDFWSAPKILGLPTTVMVAPEARMSLISVLDEANISYEVLIENVKSVMLAERVRQSKAPKVKNGRIRFTEYHRFKEIEDYLYQLAEDHPDIVTLELFQTTYDAHALRMIKIGKGGKDRPVILIEGGIHAREWIAPAFVLYIIQELVENVNNRHLIENVDWYIIPVLNPDGYEYSHTTDRLWRKTRIPNLWSGSPCIGTDGNRNFNFHWMEAGASCNECDGTYAGSAPFNQFETMGLRNVVEYYKNQIKLFLSIHSYGNYILYPWGYTSELPDNVEELHGLAEKVEAAIAAVNGTRYTIGSTANALYLAAGISPDWVKGVAGVELSYTIELPGGGIWGFDLPASRILDICSETFEGIRVFHNHIEEKFVDEE